MRQLATLGDRVRRVVRASPVWDTLIFWSVTAQEQGARGVKADALKRCALFLKSRRGFCAVTMRRQLPAKRGE